MIGNLPNLNVGYVNSANFMTKEIIIVVTNLTNLKNLVNIYTLHDTYFLLFRKKKKVIKKFIFI